MDKCGDKPAQADCNSKDAANSKLREEVQTQGGFVPRAAQESNDAAKSVIPPFVLESLAKNHPEDPSFKQTLTTTEQLKNDNTFTPRASGGNSSREVYDAKGAETTPGTKARFEGDPATGNADVDKVYEYTGLVRDFYKDVLGRNSIDDKGMNLVSTANYGQNFQNAFWNGSQMTYGHPSDASPFKTFALLDVTGHEITHGVTQNTSGIFYWGQAGALNESISDVFGVLIQQWSKHQTADQASWLIGDGIWKDTVKGRALRDMLHPGTAFDDPKVGKDPQPGNMKDYVSTWKDNGGVHYNSGIPNHAFALFATSVGGFAYDKPAKIWYEAQQHAGHFPSFASFANQTVEAAKKLGYTSEVPKLEAAWQQVGVTPKAGAFDWLTPHAPPPGEEDDKERDPKGPILDPVPLKELAPAGRR